MGESFSSLGRNAAESILVATSNPFIGLFIGLLITAIIQSSSTSTAMIVAIVASGSITVSEAVPMIMGANIGTTLTSTIVSLGYITNRNQFRRALAAGTVHDFFNIATTIILFPLEYYYGVISSLAIDIASLFVSQENNYTGAVGFKLFEAIPLTGYILALINNALVSIVVSFTLLFISIKILSSRISKILISKPKDNLENLIFNNPWKSFAFGAGITAAVQSSSITTSLVVPFVATKRIELRNAMPFILGANIGTTITAFIAVLFKSNAAMSIAVTHLLFNIIGVLLILPFPATRNIIVAVANRFGSITFNYRLTGFAYIILTFFAIPFALIFFSRTNTQITELEYISSDESSRSVIYKSVSSKNNPFRNATLEGESGSLSENIVHVNRNNNILFLNRDFFIFNDVGFCWDDEKEKGKAQICIETIIPKVTLEDTRELDSVYVFILQYYDPAVLDSGAFEYHISAKQELLHKIRRIDKSGQVLSEETLQTFNVKY